jgi:hypothetical protein
MVAVCIVHKAVNDEASQTHLTTRISACFRLQDVGRYACIYTCVYLCTWYMYVFMCVYI